MIEVVNSTGERMQSAPAKKLIRLLLTFFAKHKALKKLRPDLDGIMVRVAFVRPHQAKALNKRFRKKSYTPDVLSFNSSSGAGLGEIILCPTVIKKDAKKHGLSFGLLRDYLIIHGFLHLLGYDHQHSKAEKEMMGIQDAIFDKWRRKWQLT